MSRKLPIRTYQRKNIPNPLVKIYDSTRMDQVSKFDDILKKQDGIDNIKENKISEDSLDCDPFETTFDRIAKDAVVPPIPLDCINDQSWYDSSFDISNKQKQIDESLFHVSLGTSNTFINSDNIKCVKSSEKISHYNTKKKKKKTNNIKVLSKSKHAKELTFNEDNHIKINKKKKKLRKAMKKNENKSNNTELLYFGLKSNCGKLHEHHAINTSLNETSNNENVISANVIFNRDLYKKNIDFLNSGKSKLHNPLKETTNILNIHNKKGTCFLKSINKIQKLNDKSDLNYSSISSKSHEVSYLTKHFQIKPCSVIVDKDNIKERKLMLDKSKSITKEENSNNSLNDSLSITCQLSTNDLNLKENPISSTPIATCRKRLGCSTLCSPINTIPPIKCIADNTNENIINSKTLFTTLNTHIMNGTNTSVNQSQPIDLNALNQVSIINSTNAELCVKNNTLYEEDIVDHSVNSKNEVVDVEEYKLSHLGTPENSLNFINNRERYDTVFMDDSIDLVLRQNCSKAHQNIVLNTSVETNRSHSLFNDSESKLHSLTSDDSMTSDKLLTNTDAQKSDTDNKLKLELSTLNAHNDQEVIKLKMQKEKKLCEPIIIMKQESVEKNIEKENENIEDKCYGQLYANQNQPDINETNPFFTHIQESEQVTKRRPRNYKKNFNLSDIHENESDLIQYPTSKISQHNEKVNDYYNLWQNPTKNLNTSTNTITYCDNKKLCTNRHTSFSPEKRIFLKPGKFWARSLSILHNFQNGLNLNEMSVEKGKKWRYSVQSILDMQKKDLSSSCKEADEHITRLQLSNETQIKSCNELTKESDTDVSVLSKRFTKRISVRVVRDSRCFQNTDDVKFLEVYGICTNTTSESTILETNYTNECNTQYNKNENSYSEICSSKTAREVVLQRCSQKNYLPFTDCVPQTYLEYCQKIGEGVYGEVFLYKKDMQMSVLKIIPIEGEKLVNGEPQKKFSEILSEIVIAKELHNLRFSKVHSTNGFVEVKSIKCIKGKYPEEMINLWKNYDNEKTSDNDCPSIFDENQLYIAFELGHGGQDLEAFEFYTAWEAHTLFIQAALTLAVAEKSFEFEHRDLHWGNILISHTDEKYVHYKLDNKDIFLPSNGIKACIIDFTLSRMSYQGCCIFNDLALDPVLFTAQGEYQFEIYRLMRNKIQNNWKEHEPYTNLLWLHYILDKMVTIVRYKKKNLKKHKNGIAMLQNLKEVILSYQSAFDFVNNCNQITNLVQNISA